MFQLLLVIFGLVALIKGGFNITRNRRVSGQMSRVLGVIMLVGALLPVFLPAEFGAGLFFVTIIVVIVVGFFASAKEVKVEGEEAHQNTPNQES